jgi:hypothetical protein
MRETKTLRNKTSIAENNQEKELSRNTLRMKRHKQKTLRNKKSIAEDNQEKDLRRNSLRMKRHSGIRPLLQRTTRKRLETRLV